MSNEEKVCTKTEKEGQHTCQTSVKFWWKQVVLKTFKTLFVSSPLLPEPRLTKTKQEVVVEEKEKVENGGKPFPATVKSLNTSTLPKLKLIVKKTKGVTQSSQVFDGYPSIVQINSFTPDNNFIKRFSETYCSSFIRTASEFSF